MKVSDYVPQLYKNNVEIINIINSEEKEFENHIKLDIDNAFKDNFIKTATKNGIEKYEIMLNIPVNESLDIEDRRNQVIIKLLATPPYTYNRLLEILDMYCGKNNYEIYQNINAYTMKIITHFINLNSANSLFRTLKEIFPANIDLGVTNTNVVEIEGYIKLTNYMTTLENITINTLDNSGTKNNDIILELANYNETSDCYLQRGDKIESITNMHIDENGKDVIIEKRST